MNKKKEIRHALKVFKTLGIRDCAYNRLVYLGEYCKQIGYCDKECMSWFKYIMRLEGKDLV